MDFRKIILRKLFRRRVIGGKHTAIEHLTKGLPKHLVGEAKNAVDDLIKEGLILSKPTSYGLHVSLNIKIPPIFDWWFSKAKPLIYLWNFDCAQEPPESG